MTSILNMDTENTPSESFVRQVLDAFPDGNALPAGFEDRFMQRLQTLQTVRKPVLWAVAASIAGLLLLNVMLLRQREPSPANELNTVAGTYFLQENNLYE